MLPFLGHRWLTQINISLKIQNFNPSSMVAWLVLQVNMFMELVRNHVNVCLTAYVLFNCFRYKALKTDTDVKSELHDVQIRYV